MLAVMIQLNITLVASVIAAVTSVAGVCLQIFNARRIEQMKFEGTLYTRLLTANDQFGKLLVPDEVKEVPFKIKAKDEVEFLKEHLQNLCESAESCCKLVDNLVDAFDKDIRDEIEHYARDFRSSRREFHKFGAAYEQDPDAELIYQQREELRELACYCYTVVEAVKQGLRTQIDRAKDKLSGTTRWDDHFCDALYIDPRVRRVFNPNWTDWP